MAGHGDLGTAEINFSGEDGAQQVQRGDGDAGFGIEHGRDIIRVSNGRGWLVQSPVIEADLPPVHGGVWATDAVVLDVFARSQHFFTFICFQRDRHGPKIYVVENT